MFYNMFYYFSKIYSLNLRRNNNLTDEIRFINIENLCIK